MKELIKLEKNEAEEVLRDIGTALNWSHYFAFGSPHLMTEDEATLFNIANLALGAAYEKFAKRNKIKLPGGKKG